MFRHASKFAATPLSKSGAIFILLFGLTHCTTLKQLTGIGAKKPKAQVARILFKSMTLDQINFEAEIKIVNPNSFELEFEDLDYTFLIDKINLAKGRYSKRIIIPPQSKQFFKLPFIVKFSNASHIFKRILSNPKSVSYRWEASSVFVSQLGRMRLNFVTEDTLY